MIGNKGEWEKVPVSAGLGKCRELRDTGVENPSRALSTTPGPPHSTNPGCFRKGCGLLVNLWVIPCVLISVGPQLWREGTAGKKGCGKAPAAEYPERENCGMWGTRMNLSINNSKSSRAHVPATTGKKPGLNKPSLTWII